MRQEFADLNVTLPEFDDDQDLDDVTEVWTCNASSWSAFLALATQWRLAVGATVVRVGLDYVAAEAAIRMMGLGRKSARIFADLQVMEAAALDVFAEAAD